MRRVPGLEVRDVRYDLPPSLEHYRQVVALCWQRINALGKELAGGGFVPLMHPHAMAGLLNTAISAQEKIDKLRGVAPSEHVLHEHRETVSEFAKRMRGVPREQRLRIVD